MPYIDEESREELLSLFNFNGILEFSATPGELNFLITTLLLATKPKCYTDYNDIVGVLESCKLEFYRRMVAPYEDGKIAQEGDVY